ncbi:MAG: M48 family metallopeptidase [Proteobacteria bacterium]|nr:M48 family metallopeptidase [Pseudomonadota bacterium]
MRTTVGAVALCMLLAGCEVPPQTPREGVDVTRSLLRLMPASFVERSAAGQYSQMLRAAEQKGALNRDAAQLKRLRRIAAALVPHAKHFNSDAGAWRWEVNLIRSSAVNAFCMPGGKIGFFTGILEKLKLTDQEVAAIMGHEIAHALLEHGRARLSEQLVKQLGVTAVAVYFGLSDVSTAVLSQTATLALSLPHSRRQETDADLAGMELAARAGFDPRAAAAVWRKMAALAKAGANGQPPQFLSTHPAHATRIREIEAALPKVLPLYAAARAVR